MPAVEASESLFPIFDRHACLVKGCVIGMFQFGFGKAFMVVYGAIADELHLRNPRNCLEIGMKNGLLGPFGLVVAMTVAFRLVIERL